MQNQQWTNINHRDRKVSLPKPETYIRKNPILIDSRDRDRTLYPNTNEFVIKFDNNEDGNIPQNYRNITSIELIQAIVPQTVLNGVTGVPYLTLEIDEIRDTVQGTNTHLRNAFAFLSPQDVYGSKHLSCKFYRPAVRHYDAPLGSLKKFTIQLRKPDGSLFDFGADTAAGNPVNDDVQTIFYFVIHTIEAKHDTISIAR